VDQLVHDIIVPTLHSFSAPRRGFRRAALLLRENVLTEIQDVTRLPRVGRRAPARSWPRTLPVIDPATARRRF